MNDDWKRQLQKHPFAKQYNASKNQNKPSDKSYQKSVKTGLPNGYLAQGYFDEEGYLLETLLTDTASKIAKNFGSYLNSSQLRRFYGHAKTAEKSYSFSGDQKRFINDIKALDSFVAEARGKDKVPQTFYDFIHTNVDKCCSVKDIKEGFLPHFQAVVAYFTFHYPKSK